jgi:hypothetical protein
VDDDEDARYGHHNDLSPPPVQATSPAQSDDDAARLGAEVGDEDEGMA